MIEHEAGTYRTSAGTLIHFRRRPDGTLSFEAEDGARDARGELVKLSDDPDWPDGHGGAGDPQLFSD